MTRRRVVGAMGVWMLLAAVLAGCTPIGRTSPSPTPSSAITAAPAPGAASPSPSTGISSPAPTASAASCSPATATVAWGKTQRTDGKSTVPDAPVGVYVAHYTSGSSLTGTRHEISARPDFANPALDTLTRLDPAARDAWHTALLADAGRQPGLDDSIGTAVVMPDASPVTIDKPTRGTYVIEIAVNQLRKPYVITCTDGTVMKGVLTAPLAGGFASLVVRCGIHPHKPSAAQKVALSYCSGA